MATPFTTYSLDQLRTRTSAKWRQYGPDVLPLWVAEMDSTIAPSVAEAVNAALTEGDTGYAHGDVYGEAFAEYSRRHWNLNVDPAYTLPVIDVIRGLTSVILELTEPGAPIVLTPPVYYPFAMIVGGTQRTVVNAPLTAEGRFDAESLEKAFSEAAALGKGGMVLISNPHNPGGAVHTREELTMLATLAAKHGIRILSDEIHAPLTMPGYTFISILDIPEAADAIVVTSASKSYNLAGLKAALIVTNPASSEFVRSMKSKYLEGPSHLGTIAHVAALHGGDQWLADVNKDIDRNRHLVTELVTTFLPGAKYTPVEATYLAWVDCRDLGLGDDPGQVFLEKGKVAFSSGHVFGPGGEGHIRVNMGTSPEILTEAFRRASLAL
ncbi:MalY/PatB family protein [Aurantimicrobium sp. MWH-Uga1]|uniref:MalY/PatB family protein n=1 Tax=Aurantimicrobium sp. MWH-Uga1 TaxID=2079575 RepID=UPI000DEDA8A1|nr:aminotransferase class I/II-fold pyridoxal phosphate-dependent enzyme [Aurantimicrobium sp. MWH-Uga1]AXE54033.1 Cystathionine beta-lyase PatB [Aurantimicrobium sp. MWH-Uga1]